MTSGLIVKNGKAFFGGVAVDSLVKRYDTPTFVFSERRLLDNLDSFKRAFQKNYSNIDIFYSIKTNYELKILKSLMSAGARGEVASAMELAIAKKAGFRGEDLIADGPAWTDRDIDAFIDNRLHTLNADSLDQMQKINERAVKKKRVVRVGLRIYPEMTISLLKSFVESYIKKFGVPVSQAVGEYRKVLTMKNVKPVAISTHIGSMITSPSYYEKAIDKLVQLAYYLKRDLGIEIEEINLGGGYGLQSLNYYSLQNIILEKAGAAMYEKAASIDEFAKRIGNRFAANLKRYGLGNIKLILEPGRFIVSDSGVLLTRVVSVKRDWIFIDGGINFIPESIFFIRRGFLVANKIGGRLTHKYSISGPSLGTADVLALNQKLPRMEVGDQVVVLDAGAYSLSRSNQFTMLRPKAIYITSDKREVFLRKEEEISDFLKKLID